MVRFYFFSASVLYLYAGDSLKVFLDLIIVSVDICMLSVCSVFCGHATMLKIQAVVERVVS